MAKPTSIQIYGDIGNDWWVGDGVTENDVLEGLRALDPDAPKHEVCINSPGGRVDTGLGILSCLRRHKAQMKANNPAFKLETINHGYAMSSASVIFMAGDIRTIALGGITMIHEAWGGQHGNAEEMRKSADRLDLLSGNCADIYSALCTAAAEGEPARNSDYFRTLMKAETYYKASDAVACGLATGVDDDMVAQMSAELSPEILKGRYVEVMTSHYKHRTFMKPLAKISVLDKEAAKKRLDSLLATL